MLLTGTSAFGGSMNCAPLLTLTVTFNNVAFDTRLRTSWGFSCLIEGTEQTILCDTGGEEDILIGSVEDNAVSLRWCVVRIDVARDVPVLVAAPIRVWGAAAGELDALVGYAVGGVYIH